MTAAPARGAYSCSRTVQRLPLLATASGAHSGHCRFVHGYSRSFTFWFRPTNADANGFVVDFSACRPSKPSSAKQFDHTFLVNATTLAWSSGASSRPGRPGSRA